MKNPSGRSGRGAVVELTLGPGKPTRGGEEAGVDGWLSSREFRGLLVRFASQSMKSSNSLRMTTMSWFWVSTGGAI